MNFQCLVVLCAYVLKDCSVDGNVQVYNWGSMDDRSVSVSTWGSLHVYLGVGVEYMF